MEWQATGYLVNFYGRKEHRIDPIATTRQWRACCVMETKMKQKEDMKSLAAYLKQYKATHIGQCKFPRYR